MFYNLRLPLCPKCGDTKFVVDDVTLCVKLETVHRCSRCNIEWDAHRIKDEHGVTHSFYGELRSPTFVREGGVLRAQFPGGKTKDLI